MAARLWKHLPFLVGLAAAAAAAAVLQAARPELTTVGAANAFFAVYLVLAAARLPRLTASFLRAHAAAEDEPAPVIFAITVATVAVAVGAMFRLINGPHAPGLPELALSLLSVGLGWATIHSMAALHYAHLFWRPAADGKPQRGHQGGLDFPGTPQPGGWDFLYFAFVIGMTAQTSDVDVTDTGMRKFNLLHAVVSFFFNAVLVAAAVNLAVALGSQQQG